MTHLHQSIKIHILFYTNHPVDLQPSCKSASSILADMVDCIKNLTLLDFKTYDSRWRHWWEHSGPLDCIWFSKLLSITCLQLQGQLHVLVRTLCTELKTAVERPPDNRGHKGNRWLHPTSTETTQTASRLDYWLSWTGWHCQHMHTSASCQYPRKQAVNLALRLECWVVHWVDFSYWLRHFIIDNWFNWSIIS